MIRKATAIAHPNIAFVKYWGMMDDTLRLPMNNSISMNLDPLATITTIEFNDEYENDNVQILENPANIDEIMRITHHLDRIRALAGITTKAKVVSKNTFPRSSGIASSASGFAALTLAGVEAAGLNLSEKEISLLARQGSGSACRSVLPGYVEWIAATSSEESISYSIAPPEYWDLRDIIAIIESSPKTISSTEGHLRVSTSPFYSARLAGLHRTLAQVRTAIRQRNIDILGDAIEIEAISLHVVAMTSVPPIFYWTTTTLQVIQAVQRWRQDGLKTYFTIDAGSNVHLICEAKDELDVKQLLSMLDGVSEVIIAKPGSGTRLFEENLF